MTDFTPILNLYLAGGGSESVHGADEAADIDKINDNFLEIDGAVGLKSWTTATRPVSPFVNQFGLNTTLDTLEKWNGATWVEAGPSRLSPAKMIANYYKKSDYGGDDGAGALDSRYFTQNQLLKNGKLDAIYPDRNTSGSVTQKSLPFRSAGGADTVTNFALDSGTGQYVGTKTIPFPSGRFDDCPGPPYIFGMATSGDPKGVVVTEVPSATTKSQATLQLSRRNNVDTGFQWFAYRSINS